MKTAETRKIVSTLSEWINTIDAQVYNVKTGGEQNYDNLMLNELDIIEKMSRKYTLEFNSLSKCIRRYLWQNGENGNSKNLYIILHRINLTMRVFAEVLTEDAFWNLDTIMEYVALLYKYRDAYAPFANDQIFESIIDKIQIVNAQETIKSQWKDVLDAPNGLKTFMKVFDDIFTHALTKYEELFFHEMSTEDILCRMVKVSDCNENRFIPLPECTYQNRWNPPGRAFLYMSFGDKEHPYSEDLTLEEYVCLIECRTEENTACSFCRFRPTTKGRVLDLSYNDSQLSLFRQILHRHASELSQRGVDELLSDPEVFAHIDDEDYIKHRVKEVTTRLTISDQVLTESTVKQYLKLICSSIYTKVDGTEEEKEKAYRPFHILSEYLENKGVTGIIYPCTRSNQIIGKNLVLFDPSDACPITGTIKKYFYKG